MPVSTYGLDVLRCDAAWHRLTYRELGIPSKRGGIPYEEW